MEKTWKDFWMTGKVSDYLAYCSARDEAAFGQRAENGNEKKDDRIDGTVGDCDGHRADRYANWRL